MKDGDIEESPDCGDAIDTLSDSTDNANVEVETVASDPIGELADRRMEDFDKLQTLINGVADHDSHFFRFMVSITENTEHGAEIEEMLATHISHWNQLTEDFEECANFFESQMQAKDALIQSLLGLKEKYESLWTINEKYRHALSEIEEIRRVHQQLVLSVDEVTKKTTGIRAHFKSFKKKFRSARFGNLYKRSSAVRKPHESDSEDLQSSTSSNLPMETGSSCSSSAALDDNNSNAVKLPKVPSVSLLDATEFQLELARCEIRTLAATVLSRDDRIRLLESEIRAFENRLARKESPSSTVVSPSYPGTAFSSGTLSRRRKASKSPPKQIEDPTNTESASETPTYSGKL